jgi:DNA-binding beta-propeller fold protein YncE
MAGVALGPSGLFFVGDADTSPEEQDMAHLEDLRMQDITPELKEKSKILTVLCESEKEKTEAWRRAMMDVNETATSPRSPIDAKRVHTGVESPSPSGAERGQGNVSLARTVSRDGVVYERSFSPGLGSPIGSQGNLETRFIPASAPRSVQMRCWGLTFIADIENHCIQILRADGRHVRRVGGFGKEPGQFNALQGLVVDDEEMIIYVADTYNHRIQVFETHSPDASDMKVVRIIGEFGKEDGLFNYPVGLTLHGDQLFVADTGNDRIQILSKEGEHIRSIGLLGKHETNKTGEPLFKLPHDVCIIGKTLYVTDLGNHRIQVLTLDGAHIRSLGSNGTKTGLFVNPRRLMRGPSGLLLVTDQENSRVQILSADTDLEDSSFT